MGMNNRNWGVTWEGERDDLDTPHLVLAVDGEPPRVVFYDDRSDTGVIAYDGYPTEMFRAIGDYAFSGHLVSFENNADQATHYWWRIPDETGEREWKTSYFKQYKDLPDKVKGVKPEPDAPTARFILVDVTDLAHQVLIAESGWTPGIEP